MHDIIQNSKRHLERRDTIRLLFIAFVVFLWNRGLGLRVFHFSDRYQVNTIVAVFLIVIAIGFSMFFSPWNRFLNNFYTWSIMGLFAVMLFPTFLNLVIVKHLSPLEVLHSLFFCCGFFIFILLLSYRTDSSFLTRLNTLIVGMSTVSILFLIIVSFFPDVVNSLFVGEGPRYGRIRLISTLGPMVVYSAFYLLVMCTKGGQNLRSKIFYYVLSGVYMWYYLFLHMGRRALFSFIIIISYYLLTNTRILRKSYQIVLAMLLLLVLLSAFTEYNVLDILDASYTMTREDYEIGKGNLTIRIEGIRYYMKEFRKTGYIGFGLTTTSLSENDPIHGAKGSHRFNPGDHGIFAVIYQFGFPAIGLTIIILYRLFRDLAIIKRFGSPEYQTIAMSIWLYLCFSIVGLWQIFFKDEFSLWTGIMFFMVWRMREAIANETKFMLKH